MQAWFMTRDGVPVQLSTLALLIVTINYKSVLLIYGFALIIFKPAGIYGMLSGAMPWIYLGLFINFIIVWFMITLAIKPKFAETVVMWIFRQLSKFFKKRKFYIIEKSRKSNERLCGAFKKFDETQGAHAQGAWHYFYTENNTIFYNISCYS